MRWNFFAPGRICPTIRDYSATKLHVATTRPSSNSLLTYRSVGGGEQLVALDSVLNGAPDATSLKGRLIPAYYISPAQIDTLVEQ
jgi:hypothetical protein